MEDQTNPPSPLAPPPITPPPISSASVPPAFGGVPNGTRPAKKGRGWMFLAIILMALLFLSVMMNMANLGSMMMLPTGSVSHQAGPRMEEVILESHGASQKVVVVPVEGVIMSASLDSGMYGMVEVIRAQLKRAEEDSRVKAVILKVESPGGEVLASDEIYHEVLKFQKKSGKPVIAYMGNLAASGGYYVSAPCRWIVANELTLTGSIGVIMSSWNYRGLMDKVGVLPMTFKSGRFKDMLSGSKPPSDVSPEERKMIQDMVDEVFQKFKTAVSEGRSYSADLNSKNPQGEKGRRLTGNWEELADGRVLTGTSAFENGFVDELGNFDQAFQRAKVLAGLTVANLVTYRQHYDFSDFFRLFGSSEARGTIKVDLGMDTPKLKAGQLYFLSPTFAQ